MSAIVNTDNKVIFNIGLLSGVALLLPYLGHGLISLTMINMRVISLILIIGIIIHRYTLLNTKSLSLHYSKRSNLLDTCTLLFIVILFIYHHPEKGFILFSSQVHDPDIYPNIKMGRIVVNLIPVILLSRTIGPLINNLEFKRGLVTGFYVVGLLTLFLVFKNFQSLISKDYYQYSMERAFSTIGTSLNFLFFMIAADWRMRNAPSNNRWVEVTLVALISICSIFILSQRTAMIVATIILIAILMKIIRKGIFVPIVITMGMVALFTFQYSELESLLEYFPSQLNRMLVILGGEDSSMLGRAKAWEFAFMGFLDNPVGHGLGSFPKYYDALYPHNVLMEALFELGIFGGLIVTILILATFLWLVEALLKNRFHFEEFILMTGFLYSFKAGDFQTIGPWFFGLYVLASKEYQKSR